MKLSELEQLLVPLTRETPAPAVQTTYINRPLIASLRSCIVVDEDGVAERMFINRQGEFSSNAEEEADMQGIYCG